MPSLFKKILIELEHHAPFTFFGSFIGVLMVYFSRNISREAAHHLFYILHPAHVVMSAYVMASMYRLNKTGKFDITKFFFIGVVLSIGLATLSDSLIPYAGEWILGMPEAEVHVGFIEMWWLIIPPAIIAISVAYFKPTTHFFHSGHVFISTWASLFHIIMAAEQGMPWYYFFVIFFFLFLAVWVPCCLSDIVVPLLFTGRDDVGSCDCHKVK